MTYLFPATPTNRTFSFLGRISLSSAMGFVTGLDGVAAEAVIDFGNTGQVSLVVPDDVTVSSASGRFLGAGSADGDADGVGNASDNCPVFANPSQADADGNGRGDACECGDQNGDGHVNVLDLVAINLAIFDPARVTPLCDANGDDLCNVADSMAANVEIFSPGQTSTCARQPYALP
jgi:hypothetical protein